MKNNLGIATALMLLVACSTVPHTTSLPVSPKGAIALQVNWPTLFHTKAIPTSATKLKIYVQLNGNNLVSPVTISRPTATARIDGIEAGTNRTVAVDALNSNGEVVADGKKTGVTIQENDVADVRLSLTPKAIETPPSPPSVPPSSPPPTSTITPLTVGSSQAGNVGSKAYQRYSFSATGGTAYTIKVTASSGDPDVAVGNSATVDMDNRLAAGENNGSESLDFTPASSGTYYVAIFGYTASNYQVEVKLKGATPPPADQPSNPPPTPTVNIAVTSPSSGQTLIKGTTYSVTWTSNNVSGNVKLKLWKGNTEVVTLGANEANDGHIPFNLEPSWLDGSDYRIQVMDLSSTSAAYSGYFTIQAPAVAQLPAPTGVSAQYESTNARNYITWHSVPGATGYKIYWGTSSSVTTASQAMPITSTLDYGHTRVQPGFTYHYRVVAMNGNAESPNLSAVASAQVPSAPTCPSPPQGVNVYYDSGQGGNYLSWFPGSGATGYKIYWGTSSNVTTSSNYYGSTSNTAALHTGVSGGTTYYYRVLSTGACDSGLSSTASVTVPQTYNPTVSVTSSANSSVPVLRRGTGHSFTQNGNGLPPNSSITYRFTYPDSSVQTLNKTTDGSGFVSNVWTPNSSAMTGTYYLLIRYTANGQTLDTSSVSYRVDP